MAEEVSDWKPICVASTQGNNSPRSLGPNAGRPGHGYSGYSPSNYFKGAQWSPDGTTLMTDSADHHIRTFILPPDLLDERASPHELSSYSTFPSAEPTYATAIYPYYSLQDPSTTLFLSSVRDHPIKLTSALAPTTMATYSLIHPTTEAFIAPHTIIYPSMLGGTHFLTGSDSLICLFDISRPGNDGPVSWMPTIPSKRKQIVGGGIGMKGIVSAMAVNPVGDGILAAGTFTRQVGLYDSNGSGQLLGTFSVAKTEANREIGGRGVTQLLWSPCGRYLYVSERKSDGVLVYDIRVTGQLLGWLRGRKAFTNQRMNMDVVPSGDGDFHEIWAGATDGFMRVWRNPTHTAGGKDPDWEWKVHNDSVTSTVLHPMGTVAATCSGQRHYPDDASDDKNSSSSTVEIDNTLKVWSMPFLGTQSDG
ncbi:uncharacterized protein EURHEDRAFT_401465 [Aspergillus ruber CBS 135680]|uniref:WD repeat-containing protein n=1 Tax=Aspergillus ruber (strain CBS 135680) TaxID=1388766 RepID=A0A017SHD2_ASPRC|nr:WD repeat-containing protein [Aspergillus ruber CBS 135680]EYE96378.1 WD repeat-containing protein [Aspergillus ruber CBS 135680]